MRGFLLVDKKSGESSFDVIRRVRKELNIRKIGHSGTLDPLATGLMVLAIGEGTKLLEFFIGCDKEYLVEGKFGWRSSTFDAEGELEEVDKDLKVSEEELALAMQKFKGEIVQVPPKYSALKIDGKKAYDKARAGEDFEMQGRKVKINSFEIEDFAWPLVRFRVDCGSGTYIRSLIHDLGAQLGCGAYVKELRRTVVGDFSLNNIDGDLMCLEDVVASFPKFELNIEQYEVLKNGGVVVADLDEEAPVMGILDGKLVGVLEPFQGGVKFMKQIFE